MPDAREYQSLLADAEAAAKRGDFVTAEALLREGLPRQETALGDAHPDVASSLNNLAVICESTGRLDEAERLFRRAFAVATAAAARPGAEKILATSRENLRDFCTEHGRPFDERGDTPWGLGAGALAPAPAPAPTVAADSGLERVPMPASARQAPAPVTAATPRTARDAPAARPPTAASATRAPTPGGTFGQWLAVVAFAALAATIGWRWMRTDDGASTKALSPAVTDGAPVEPPTERPADPSRAIATAAPPQADAASAAAPPAAVVMPTPAAPVETTRRAGAEAAAPEAAPTPPPPVITGPANARPRVLAADLCASLETGGPVWRCAPVDSPVVPGRLSFVTRIASPRAAQLQHRWSREGQVRQSVRLSVAASPTAGYRTFSRQTVTAGAWAVAVLDAGGVVLEEVRFEVRER